MERGQEQPDPPVGNAFFTAEFESTFEAMTGVLNRAVDALVARRWIASGQEPCTRLCLEEALVNAIRHGNLCNPARKVRLKLHEEGDQCVIRVFDEGNGFAPERVKPPEVEQLGGRGVCLMRHFMDRVEFNAADGCLEMAFRRKAS